MYKKIIIANWKMNPDAPGRAVRLAREIERGINQIKNIEVVVAPPHPFLMEVGKILRKAKLGAQNMHWANVGPYTGEVSWHQLKHCGAKYVIVGHSERRIHLGETDTLINKKIRAAVTSGLVPVLAVGEQKRTTDKKMRMILAGQIVKDLAGISRNAFGKGIIAYEPVWAIGTGKTATPKHAKIALESIKEILRKLWNTKSVSLPVLYGGSVDAKNAATFVAKSGGGMDGLLVGSAGLHPNEFVAIIKKAATAA